MSHTEQWEAEMLFSSLRKDDVYWETEGDMLIKCVVYGFDGEGVICMQFPSDLGQRWYSPLEFLNSPLTTARPKTEREMELEEELSEIKEDALGVCDAWDREIELKEARKLVTEANGKRLRKLAKKLDTECGKLVSQCENLRTRIKE